MIDETKAPPPAQKLPTDSTDDTIRLEPAAAKPQKRNSRGTQSNRSNSKKINQIAGTKHVLFGRGKGFANKPGNQRMRQIIEKYRGQYIGGSRIAKRRLIRQAYLEIIEGGTKFLKQVGNTDEFVEVEAEEAIEKIGHSIRWRKGKIQESAVNPNGGPSIQDNLNTFDNRIAQPEALQAMMQQLTTVQQQSVSSPLIESALLRQALEQHAIGNQQQISSEVSMPLIEGARLQLPMEMQEGTNQQQLSSEVTDYRREFLGQPAERQQEPIDLSLLLPPNQMTTLLFQQVELERLRSMGLMGSMQVIQPVVASMPSLQALQAIDQDQELLRILALRGDIFPGL